MGSWKDKPAPQGFGFIGRHWMPRRPLAGTYDANWEKSRAPALPADFDYQYFQAAHPDLVTAKPLEGTEAVQAINVHPGGPLNFTLPGHGVTATAYFRDREQTAKGQLDTVVLLPEVGKLVLVWRCHFPCPRSFALLQAVQVLPIGKTPARPKAGAAHA